jgi:hypothetical protein
VTSASIGSATASVSSGSDRTNSPAKSGDDTASSFAQIFARSTATGADPQKNVSASSSQPNAPVSGAKTIMSAALALPASPTAQTAQKIPRRHADATAVPAGDTSAAAPATLAVLPQAVQPDASAQPAAEAPPAAASKVGTTPVSAASSAPTNPSSPVNGLAFAMRLNPAGDKNNTAPFTAASLNAAAPEAAPAIGPTVSFFTAQLKAAAGSSTGPVPTPGVAAGSGLAVASTPLVATTASPAATTPAPSTPAPSGAAVSEPIGDNGLAANAPVRGVHVQIAGADDQRVDLRLLEHAGSLSVSVRSSDSGVTRNLQDSLPELNSRLAEQHYQTEIWTPASTFHSSSNGNSDSGQGGTGAGNKNGGSFGNGNPNGNPGSQNGGSGQQPSGQQSKQPDWLQELASSGREP